MLLTQAQSDMSSQELDILCPVEVLQRVRSRKVEFVELKVPSPFALALMVERFREKPTTEKLICKRGPAGPSGNRRTD
jgi:ATP-dependent Lhr-like helicase